MDLVRVLTLLGTAGVGLVKGEYAENLSIQPLSRNEIMSTFSFNMSQPIDTAEHWAFHEYTTFPRSLGQIIDQSNTKELHLRFGQGWWDAESWGSPPAMGTQSGGIGVEVWAWVGGDSFQEAWDNWRRLVHSLGGYFCASINFIDETQTTFPSDSILSPQGTHQGNAWLLRGLLPAEPICTENLTPFLKLLPCQSKAGIASLLDGHTLFRSLWQTMSVDVFHPDNGTVALHQAVSSVVNIDQCKEDPLPRHIPSEELLCDRSKPWSNDWTCYPSYPRGSTFTLSKLFGRTIQGRCPLMPSDRSVVSVKAPENWLVDNDTASREFLLDGNPQMSYDLEIRSEDSSIVHEKAKPLLHVDRSFSGWGQQNGGIRSVFTNPEEFPINIEYLEMLPWFLRLYLHTTRVQGNGTILDTKYIPSRDRERPSQLELSIHLPPRGKLEIEYEFDKSLLLLEEYPPDANHGFEVPPGLAVAETPFGRYEVRTSSLLLSLPVPDFSMPYNVIILTSTVMALVFGTLFNLIVRDVMPEDEIPPSKGALAAIKGKLFAKFQRK